MTLWRRLQHGWPEAYPLAQFPNVPLLVALLASLIGRFLDGDAAGVARVVFYVGLTAWAALELFAGANAFRRLLGAAGLALVAFRLIQALTG